MGTRRAAQRIAVGVAVVSSFEIGLVIGHGDAPSKGILQFGRACRPRNPIGSKRRLPAIGGLRLGL
jgi:hypothetical protein